MRKEYLPGKPGLLAILLLRISISTLAFGISLGSEARKGAGEMRAILSPLLLGLLTLFSSITAESGNSGGFIEAPVVTLEMDSSYFLGDFGRLSAQSFSSRARRTSPAKLPPSELTELSRTVAL